MISILLFLLTSFSLMYKDQGIYLKQLTHFKISVQRIMQRRAYRNLFSLVGNVHGQNRYILHNLASAEKHLEL